MTRLWTVDELCENTNMRERTAYYLVATKKIPHIRLTDRILRFDPEAIRTWIEERTHGVTGAP
jgi:excisionase family DNA binding protein